MKQFILLVCIVLTIPAGAQIQNWPTAGTTPSPLTLKLPANRYVPSTKRYNLVWSDQLYNLPANETQFIAQNYMATQKIFASDAAAFRTYNPNFLVVSYHLANGLNPKKHDDCPNPKTLTGSGYIGVVAPNGFVSEWNDYFLPWLATKSIAQNSVAYERMFQHYDVLDSAHRVWHQDPFWTMNLANADWRTYMGDVDINWMSGNQNDGCFLDVSVETAVSLYNPKQGDPNPYNFNWFMAPHSPLNATVNNLTDFSTWMNAQYLSYYQYLYSRYHTANVDYLVMPNTDQMVTGWYDPTWTDGNGSGETIDGAMMEDFGGYTGSDMYLTLERGIRHITGRGKLLVAQWYDNSQFERYRRTGMYMLIKNENSFLCVFTGNPDWYPEYEIDLGDQSAVPTNINSLRVAGSADASLFKRDYANGMVLCNTSGSTMQYALSGNNWKQIVTSGGGQINSNGSVAAQSITYTPVSGAVNVNASDCLILKNTTGTGVAENTFTQNQMLVAQNLSDHVVTVKIAAKNNSPADIYISDAQGRKLKTVFNGNISIGENNFQADISNFSSGIYFITYRGETMQCRKVTR